MAPLAERYVRIRLDSKGFSGELKQFLRGDEFKALGVEAGKDWASGFKTAVKAELAAAKYKVKVEADWSGFRNQPGGPRVKAPGSSSPGPASATADVDPVLAALQADVRRQVAALSRQVAVHVPVTADTAKLRDQLSAELRALQDKAKVKVDAEAPDRAKFETELRAMLASAQARVAGFRPPKVPVELDPLITQFQANVRRELAGLRRLAAQIPVNADTDGLRRDLALKIAAIEHTLKIKVPVGSADGSSIRAGLESSLGDLKSLLGGALGVTPQALQALSGGFDAISGSATRAAGSASQLGSALSEAAGPAGTAVMFGLIAAAITAIPAAALAASGAVIALGGALASLPALGVGLGASFGALSLGFDGISDHLKALPKSAGGAAKSLSAVHSATRSLATAQRELAKATKEVDKARQDEIIRIRDLNLNLRESIHSQADAAAAVAEARAALAAAQASGDVNAIGKAQRALDDANDSLEEAKNHTADLSDEKAKADKDGVEGSDQVQAALERQRDATDRLAAAQEALADAQKSSGGAASAALAKLKKLAPAAQEVVDKIKQLRPAFEDLRLSVQQKLFAGVAGELQKLSDTWLPQLKETLGKYASEFNGLFKRLSESVRKPEFVSNLSTAAETVRSNLDKVGKAVTGPLVDAFGRLARAAKPFIDAVGDKVAGLVKHFSDWIRSADESGKLQKFMQDAAYYFGKLWDIGGNIVGIFSDLFGIFFNTPNQGGAKDYLSGLNDQLVLVRDWLKNPENQQKIKDLIEKFGEFVQKAEKVSIWIEQKGLPALSKLIDVIQKVNDAIERWKDRVTTAKDTIVGAFDLLVGGVTHPLDLVRGQLEQFQAWASGLGGRLNFNGAFDGIYNAARLALNNAIDLFNRLHLGLSFSLSPSSASFSGVGRRLAAGGIARATPGGIQATIAEGGKDEVVSPVEQMQGYIRTAVAEANAASPAGHGGDITIPIYLFPGAAEYDRFVISAAERNQTKLAKIVNAGNKGLGYAG